MALVAGLDEPGDSRGHPGVELRTGVGEQLPSGRLDRQRRAVGPVGGHRVEGIAAGDDSRLDRDLLTCEPVGIAATVPALVRLELRRLAEHLGQAGYYLEVALHVEAAAEEELLGV